MAENWREQAYSPLLRNIVTDEVSYIHGHGCEAFIDPHHLLDSCKLVVG